MSEQRPRFEREKKTLQAMIKLYCGDHHRPDECLCQDCKTLEAYALIHLDRCKFGEDKPKCADCHIHCYSPAMREKIRNVMRYAGPRMMVKHPVLAVGHLLDGVRHPAKPT